MRCSSSFLRSKYSHESRKCFSYNLNLSLPTGKETVNVIVKQSGTTVYDKTVSTSQGTLTVTLYGMGTTNIEVYYDGLLIKTQKVSF